MGAIHVTSSTPITRAQAQLINRLARAALNEQVVARRLLIRALRRRGLSRSDIARYLRLQVEQVVSEESAAGQAGSQRVRSAG